MLNKESHVPIFSFCLVHVNYFNFFLFTSIPKVVTPTNVSHNVQHRLDAAGNDVTVFVFNGKQPVAPVKMRSPILEAA